MWVNLNRRGAACDSFTLIAIQCRLDRIETARIIRWLVEMQCKENLGEKNFNVYELIPLSFPRLDRNITVIGLNRQKKLYVCSF